MKRSEINQYIKQAIEFFDKNNFKLPIWATATPEEWEKMAATGNYNEIIENQLGWDITDFAKNDFLKEGLSLFTVRNGSQKQGAGGKTYCEKIMISYDRLWQTMSEKGVTQYTLIKKYNISPAQITRLKRNESVSTHTIEMFCKILKCNVEDIMQYIEDDM